MTLDLTALISDLRGRTIIEGNPPIATPYSECLAQYLSLHARGDSARLMALAEKIQKGTCDIERHDVMFLLDEVKKANFAPIVEVYISKKLFEVLNAKDDKKEIDEPKEKKKGKLEKV